jgi:hypothetical protein
MLHVPAQRRTTHPILLEDDGDILMHFFELRKTRFFAVAWTSRVPPALIPPSSSSGRGEHVQCSPREFTD